MKLINKDHVLLELDCNSQAETFKAIATKAKKLGFCNDEDALIKAFQKREKESTTGFEDGIAIPHAKTEAIIKPAIFLIKFKSTIDWKSMDGKPTKVAIAILIPGSNKIKFDYLSVLAKISTELIDEKFRKDLKEIKDPIKLADLINKVANAPKKKATTKQAPADEDQLFFVGITACPTGVAHTFMAAKKLTKVGESLGYKVKIETQGAEGIGNKLTEADIKKADYVIIAADINVEGMHRFGGKKVLHTHVAAPLKNAEKVFEEAQEAPMQNGGNASDDDAFINRQRAKSKTGPMQHLMSGVSYMIPFVVCGGILLAISLGLGATIDSKTHAWVFKNHFWNAVNIIGVAGFTLMIPILGGFIANSIGGRSAIAPAMILSYIIGNGSGNYTDGTHTYTDMILFNWKNMDFGGFDVNNPAHAGFFGSIAVGFAVGYAIRYWFKVVHIPSVMKPIEPIIIIPLLFTFVGWLFFATLCYWPLYELSTVINWSIKKLIDHDLLFLVGLILGAMVAFDMGGPINKVAFLLGASYVSKGHPEIMGMVAAAIAVPPIGCGIGTLIGRFVFKAKFDKEDESNASAAIGMGIFGITEGAIHFAVKYPKFILSNVIGGSVASALAALFMFGDNAAHGGPIVYFVGAIGHAVKSGDATHPYVSVTAYGYGLLYLMVILIGSCVTAALMIVIKKHDDRKIAKKMKLEEMSGINNVQS